MFGKNYKIWSGHAYEVPSLFELDKQILRFCNKSTNSDPEFAHDGDSGFDLRAFVTETEDNVKKNEENNELYLVIKPMERRLIHTGLYFELPDFVELQVRPRSGRSIKEGLTVINTPGTVDASYRGECCVLVVNLSKNNVTINNGDRIAQAVLCPVFNSRLTVFEKTDEIKKDTTRGEKGFNSTGVK